MERVSKGGTGGQRKRWQLWASILDKTFSINILTVLRFSQFLVLIISLDV